jgi:Fe-S-cluster containining protein
MLEKLLSKQDCAECQICCTFESYDLWETPVISDELRKTIADDFPDQEFIRKGNSWLMRMEQDDDGLYYCPMLDTKTGCMLDEKKPFDCRIWPYRVMDFNGARVISIASICPVMFKKPLNELVEALTKGGLAKIIFDEADKNPDIVKQYQDGYPILVCENYMDLNV